MGDLTEGWYYIIISRDLLNMSLINIKFSAKTIECGVVTYQCFMAPVTDLHDHDFYSMVL